MKLRYYIVDNLEDNIIFIFYLFLSLEVIWFKKLVIDAFGGHVIADLVVLEMKFFIKDNNK